MVEALVENGADVNKANNDGNTPLHYLARCLAESEENKQIQMRVIRKMVEVGANVDAQNYLGETPLHIACFLGNKIVTRILLEAFAEPNAITKQGETCLHYSVQAAQEEITVLLLEFGANPYVSCCGENPIDYAHKFHLPKIAECLLTVRVSRRDTVTQRERKTAAKTEDSSKKRISTMLFRSKISKT